MSDVFISYARSTAQQAQQVAEALRKLGYSVWIDDDLPAHRAYSGVIEEEMTAAKAAVVIWSADAVRSEWVQSEANRAREGRKLVQVITDKTRLPMPFDTIQCADLAGWAGDPTALGWRKVLASIAALVGESSGSAGPTAGAAPPLPSKPSIAVLPFINLSGDLEQDYFADGMVEEIARALSRFKSIFVIAGGSSLSFKGTATTPQQAARILGVRYVLEGSVRKAGGRVRIAAKLIDAADGVQIWADRFDDTLEDIFLLQDKVALSVAGIIEPAVKEAEIRRASARPTENMGSYDLCLRALSLYRTLTKVDVLAALDLLQRALAIDPNSGPALGMAALCHGSVVANGWSDDLAGHLQQAGTMIERALRFAGDDPDVLVNVAIAITTLGGTPEAGLALADRAMEINPGSSVVWLISGWLRVESGEPERGFEQLKAALRLDPLSHYQPWALCGLGIARFAQRRFGEAISPLKQSFQLSQEFSMACIFLAASYSHLGEIAAARETVARFKSLTALDISDSAAKWPDPEARKLLLEGIAIAEGPNPTAGLSTPPHA
jgi:adenylate cyclase